MSRNGFFLPFELNWFVCNNNIIVSDNISVVG